MGQQIIAVFVLAVFMERCLSQTKTFAKLLVQFAG